MSDIIDRNTWRGVARIDPSLIARRDRGDSPYVRIFPCTHPDCALPLGHLCDHISIDEAWN